MIPPDSTRQSGIRCIVSGLVQGVGFRRWVMRHARRTGITGWVRNRPDGCVELFAAGGRDERERFIDLVRAGPPGSSVRHVEVTATDGVACDPFTVLSGDDTM